MLLKTGEFSDVSNWRPIAVLKITCKIFAKWIHTRIALLLGANQCHDQVGFRPNLGVDHAFVTLDSIVSTCLVNGMNPYGSQAWICVKLWTELSLIVCLPPFVMKKSRRLTFAYCLVCTDPRRNISKTALDLVSNKATY